MTNYPIILHTAEEARAWAEAHPGGWLANCRGLKVSATDCIGDNPPYTVLKTGNTIMFDGKTYKEGETVNVHPCRLFGCVIKSTGYSFEILHITDEVAEKKNTNASKSVTKKTTGEGPRSINENQQIATRPIGTHSPEPWTAKYSYYMRDYENEDWVIYDANGENICAENYYSTPGILLEEDAKRIIACVNACKGIPTDQLQSATINTQELDDALAKLAMMREAVLRSANHKKTLPEQMSFIEYMSRYDGNDPANKALYKRLHNALQATQADVEAWKAALVKPYVDDVKLLREALQEHIKAIKKAPKGTYISAISLFETLIETDREEYRQ